MEEKWRYKVCKGNTIKWELKQDDEKSEKQSRIEINKEKFSLIEVYLPY